MGESPELTCLLLSCSFRVRNEVLTDSQSAFNESLSSSDVLDDEPAPPSSSLASWMGHISGGNSKASFLLNGISISASIGNEVKLNYLPKSQTFLSSRVKSLARGFTVRK